MSSESVRSRRRHHRSLPPSIEALARGVLCTVVAGDLPPDIQLEATAHAGSELQVVAWSRGRELGRLRFTG